MALSIIENGKKLESTIDFSNFLKEFKKATSKTPYQYLTDIRMEQASQLIGDESITLVDLAIRLGFNDQSHFSRAFKNRFGESPGAYRKKSGKR